MTEQIMDYIAHVPKVTMGEFVSRFTRALSADDIDEYCAAFRDYIKLFPHNIIVDREKFFQATFYGMGLMADSGMVESEIATSKGYVDIILHGAKKVWVMEFKKDKTPDFAMKQILAKKYYEPYVIKGDKVVLVGINFDPGLEVKKGRGNRRAWEKKAGGVEVDWLIKEYDQLTELEKAGHINKKPEVCDERSLEIARKMLDKGSTIEFVVDVTGLSVDVIQKLKQRP
jgi:hypothetical protein